MLEGDEDQVSASRDPGRKRSEAFLLLGIVLEEMSEAPSHAVMALLGDASKNRSVRYRAMPWHCAARQFALLRDAVSCH